MSHPAWKGLVTGPSLEAILDIINIRRRLRFFPTVLAFWGGGEANIFEDYDIGFFVEET
jgi:hypothetical protein